MTAEPFAMEQCTEERIVVVQMVERTWRVGLFTSHKKTPRDGVREGQKII
jgi:hypothetical protein